MQARGCVASQHLEKTLTATPSRRSAAVELFSLACARLQVR